MTKPLKPLDPMRHNTLSPVEFHKTGDHCAKRWIRLPLKYHVGCKAACVGSNGSGWQDHCNSALQSAAGKGAFSYALHSSVVLLTIRLHISLECTFCQLIHEM